MTSRPQRPRTRRPACTSSASSRSPAPSATSIPTSTVARAISPAKDWGGYHRIEKALWVDNTTDGLDVTIKELRNDVNNLNDIAIKADFDPVDIAQGSVGLIAEAASKITGEEERYSHTDLCDFEANVEGAEAGSRSSRRRSRRRTPTSSRDRGAVRCPGRAAGQYHEGDGFDLYDKLSDGRRRSWPAVDALAEPLSKVPQRRRVHERMTDRRQRPRRARAAADRRRRARRSAPTAAARPATAGPATGDATGPRPVPRRAPGRHRHRRPGPAALRRVRPDRPTTAPSCRACSRPGRGRAPDDRRERSGETRPLRPPDDTGEALGLEARRLTITSASGPGCSTRRRRPFGLAAQRPQALATAPLPAGRHRPRSQRRRPVRPGVLGRSAGRLPRRPQPRPDRPRRRSYALVAARLRQHVVHEPRAGDAAQPDGLQGRHQQHHAPRTRTARRSSCGSATRPHRVDERRHLPRRPPHPDADRDLGPHRARRAGGHHRSRQGQRRAVGASDEFDSARPRRPRPGRADDRPSTPTSGSRAPNQLRGDDPAPRLLVHRRHRRRTGRLDAGLFFIAFQRDPDAVRADPAQARAATCSTSTSSTPRAPCSPSRPAWAPASTSVTDC